MNTVKLRTLEGGLCDVPIREEHSRGRNWCSVVTPNPTSPGGMARSFWASARRNQSLFFYVVPPDLHAPCVIEFGADYVTMAGRKHPKRWYGVLVEITRSELVVTECAGPREAFDLCNELLLEIEASREKSPAVVPFVSPAPPFVSPEQPLVSPAQLFVSPEPAPPAAEPELPAIVASPPAAGPQTE